ncbi:hypothetical protein CARUB_v10008036mg [Capsella rubella]|uniref:NAC domain-containing protein n=1 Tax=Capsella rubella TaxID=81985 RepID=R0ETF2_9BRAS|nr:hypothetical protein CARUB_v10008036mg [Capsella rubella]
MANELDNVGLSNVEDEVIISRFLKRMVINGDSMPEHFIQDVDVFNKNPNVEFDAERPGFVIVKPRTESCGKTDGCESGCWKIIGRDKLIKSEKTGKVLGFKKILKFCLSRGPREYKRSWVMEEYRLTKNLNKKQDHLICKIQFLFRAEIISLLAKHFSYLSTTISVPVPANLLLPAYGYYSPDTPEDDVPYLITLAATEGNDWPSYVTNNNVYRLHPIELGDPFDQMFEDYGICIFSNETCRTSDICYDGYWKIMHHDRPIRSKSGETIGFKKVFRFHTVGELRYVCEGVEVKVTWTIDEYRLNDAKHNKLLCVIKFTSS